MKVARDLVIIGNSSTHDESRDDASGIVAYGYCSQLRCWDVLKAVDTRFALRNPSVLPFSRMFPYER